MKPLRQDFESIELCAPRRHRIGGQESDVRITVAVHLFGDGIITIAPCDERGHRGTLSINAEWRWKHGFTEGVECCTIEMRDAFDAIGFFRA